MLSSIPQQLLLQVLLILLNAFFAATEIAVISLNPTKLKKLEEDGDRKAARLLKMVEQPAGFLSTIQIGITLAGFLGSAFAADNFSDYLVSWVYDDLGVRAIPLGVLDTLSVIVITLILSYFTLILGELVPKRIAMQKPMQVAKISCGVVSAVAFVMKPVVWFLSFSTNLVLKLLHMKTEAEDETVTEDEIRMMVELGEEKGTIDTGEKEWIQNIFEFDDTSVREAMTRQPDVKMFSVEAETKEILQTIEETGLSRYPVYGKNTNDILGILNAREFLLDLNREQPKGLRALLRPAYFVSEMIHTDDLFRDMQQKKVHIAVVIDEYGEMSGVITIEDMLEEIVGNIYDEFDPAELPEIEQLGENLWRVSGGIDVDTLSKELDIELPEDVEYDTVGGMVFSCLHTIPKDGTQPTVQINGLEIQVQRIENRRIEEALVRKILPSSEKTDSGNMA
ncbi:hemolysin family protein [Massiliimalia timonensis]|uniref:hemolysin family protein n=1 Tax=Massiliimalia timonensis TaxID=1987501 RepID=UPI002D21A50D|nr:hemolysin family protein [Massiliimalia timonensis]